MSSKLWLRITRTCEDIRGNANGNPVLPLRLEIAPALRSTKQGQCYAAPMLGLGIVCLFAFSRVPALRNLSLRAPAVPLQVARSLLSVPKRPAFL